MIGAALPRGAMAIAFMLALIVPPEKVAATHAQPASSEVVAMVSWSPTGPGGSSLLVQEPMGIYRVRSDTRLCPYPLCGGAFVSLANQSATYCADGETREACYVARVDFDELDLTDGQVGQLRTALYADQAFVTARLRQMFFAELGLFGELEAIEGWKKWEEEHESPLDRFRAF